MVCFPLVWAGTKIFFFTHFLNRFVIQATVRDLNSTTLPNVPLVKNFENLEKKF